MPPAAGRPVLQASAAFSFHPWLVAVPGTRIQLNHWFPKVGKRHSELDPCSADPTLLQSDCSPAKLGGC